MHRRLALTALPSISFSLHTMVQSQASSQKDHQGSEKDHFLEDRDHSPAIADKISLCISSEEEGNTRSTCMDASPSTRANTRLRQARIARNWRQDDLAEQL